MHYKDNLKPLHLLRTVRMDVVQQLQRPESISWVQVEYSQAQNTCYDTLIAMDHTVLYSKVAINRIWEQ